MGCCCGDVEENGPRYNGTALYLFMFFGAVWLILGQSKDCQNITRTDPRPASRAGGSGFTRVSQNTNHQIRYGPWNCQFLGNQSDIFIHILQSCLTGIGAMMRLSNINEIRLTVMSNIGQYTDTIIHNKRQMGWIYLEMLCVNGDIFIKKISIQRGYQLCVCWWPIANRLNQDVFCIMTSWWRHQMETFSALLAICAGIHRSPVNSPHKGQWRGALMVSLSCAWISGWVNNREAGDLGRNCAHYDVIVMI